MYYIYYRRILSVLKSFVYFEDLYKSSQIDRPSRAMADAMEEKTSAGTAPECKLKSTASMPLLPRPISAAGEDRQRTGKNATADRDRTPVRPMGKAMSSFQMGEQAYDDSGKNPM